MLGIKILVELEEEFSIRKLIFKFLNRSVPVFPANKETIEPKDRRYVKSVATFWIEYQD